MELEDRDKTEVERAKARAERAEQQLSGLMGKVTAMEKGAWVRSAAAELDFHDPEDAVQHLRDNLGNLEDASDARRLVKSLAKNKKHLVKAKEPDGPRPGVNSLFQGAGVPSRTGSPVSPGSPRRIRRSRPRNGKSSSRRGSRRSSGSSVTTGRAWADGRVGSVQRGPRPGTGNDGRRAAGT